MSSRIDYHVRDETGRLIEELSYPRSHELRVGDSVGLAEERRRIVAVSPKEDGIVDLVAAPEPGETPYTWTQKVSFPQRRQEPGRDAERSPASRRAPRPAAPPRVRARREHGPGVDRRTRVPPARSDLRAPGPA